MHIFVTGGAGFVGQAVVRDLLSQAHHVTALAHSDESASRLIALGAKPVRGGLEDLDVLEVHARDSDGVIHLGFVHDYANFGRACAIDRTAITAMAEGLKGSGKVLAIASGTLLVPTGVVATEDTEGGGDHPPFTERVDSEKLLFKLGMEQGFRGCSVRLPPTVHDAGDKGMIPALIGGARKGGIAPYVNGGLNVWPAVHRHDAAILFRSVVTKGQAATRYHAVAEEGVRMVDIMKTIGKALGIPAEDVTLEKAQEVLGAFGRLSTATNPASSEKTRKEMNWSPSGPGLLADMEVNYF